MKRSLKKWPDRERAEEILRRLEAIRSFRRHREIWRAIALYDRLHAAGKHRVRGVGHAAKRAGF